MSINQLYHNWIEQIRQLVPGQRITRIRNLAWLMIGMMKSKSVHLSKIAVEIPGKAKVSSLTRRLCRFIKNSAVEPRLWYENVARQWILWQAESTGEIRLIMDGTRGGQGVHMLLVALAFRKRAIPLAWDWLRKPHNKGRCTADIQLELLKYVHTLIPEGTPVLLVGDTEFGDVPIFQQLEAWHWHYVLRQKGIIQVKLPSATRWINFGDLINRPGQLVWVEGALVTLNYVHMTNLLAYWKAGEELPWLLMTNLDHVLNVRKGYERRMWIEETFGDFKSNGVDLETTHLRDLKSLSRLTLAVALLFDWFISTGFQVIKNGDRAILDHPNRRDLSIFQIGFRFIRRCLANLLFVSIRFCPVPTKLSGG